EACIELTAPEGERIGGVYIQFYEQPCAFVVEVSGENGDWVTAASCDTDYLTGWAALSEGAQTVRVRPSEAGKRLYIAEIHVYGVGEAPAGVQRWQPPLEKADLLVLSAHPDDEVLFMGGTIPYYAGERGLGVQVAYLVPSTPYRRLELLDGLWLCGVTNYPDLGPFADRFMLSLADMYASRGWSEARVMRYVTELYRRYRPEVVVTHDINGEYGHGAHKVAADAAQRCVALAADESYQVKDSAYTEPWQIKKLYLHLYEEGALRMDWRTPLEAFGGRTAFDMAQAAFACHISQQRTSYRVEDFGPYDNAVFGLAFSSVGEDIQKDDFFEHIGLEGK
ncbi:MAG: PIG-L deacetylase family protein, partial [Clostridia bacterium]|nr:PIG-L deacetylase family protein [Clostridia bacterium]